ncbi:MAG: T9SS type A sorting domain-containing protein [Ignavibacteriaceae bacterium]|nr:T9SS type A sorting domain-containing protein [Ignavibacteriaceae bacterium]
MKIFCTLLLIIAFGFAYLNAQDTPQSVAKILNETGSIKPNTSGSYNTDGYEMTYGKNKEPVFSKINSTQGTSTYGWGSLGSGRDGTNGAVYAMAVDGSGNIYVGGSFTLVSDISANNIAKWDGTSWSTLTSGVSNGVNNTVQAIAVSGSDVYVGGQFTLLGDGTTSAKYIAKWNGSAWSTLTSGFSNGVINYVYAIAISGSDVYIGGAFSLLGDGTTSAKYIVKWSTATNTWSTLTSGVSNGVNNTVNSIAISSSNVYVGGNFTLLGDGTTSAKRIAKWDTTTGTWSTLTSGASNGVNNIVYAIAVSGTDVYMGGQFTLLGDGTTSANYITKWNGTAWSTLKSGSSNGVNSTVNVIAVNSTDVYVGGNFSKLGNTGTTSANYIAKWDGTAWSTLTSGASNGVNNTVNAIAVNSTEVYAGGQFTLPGDATTPINYMTKWNGTTFSPVGSGNNGVNYDVAAISISGTDVYVGGSFTLLGDGTTSANNIVKWNSATCTWSTLTSGASNGVNNIVYAIAVSGTDVYVGGSFTFLGDGSTSAKGIAKWNGSTWSTLPSGASNGVNSVVQAISISGSDVYVGGSFTLLGDGTTSAKNIAKWNTTTSTWSTLTSGASNGVNNTVQAIAVSGSDVYVGGQFTLLGDGSTSAKRIAKWNGTTWSTLTSGASNGVSAGVNTIAISGTDVYVGGPFTLLGDGTTSANHIAKWNGTTWSVLTSGISNGVNYAVDAIAVSGTDVYVGGGFTLLGNGTSAKYIAKWNGASLSALDKGVNSIILAFRISPAEGKMYLGGGFTILNNNTGAFYVGTFTDPGNSLPVELSSFTSKTAGRNITLNWTTSTEKNSNNFDIERSVLNDNAAASWIAVGSVKASDLSNSSKQYSFTDKNLMSGRFQYRLKMIDNDGSYIYSEVIQGSIGLPASFVLTQNYPNPFNPSTRIDYQVPNDAKVIVEVYSITGQKIAELVNQDQQAGYYSISFGSYSSKLASGVYIYKIAAIEKATGNTFTGIKKMILLK